MRKAFISELVKIAEKDNNVWLICGDLGFSILEEFKNKFPDRFINAGISEQNIIGLASGLALSGKKVFVYSIANFITFRCLEQIRNDICYHNLDITIIGVGAGVSYGVHGYTHHAIEDVSILRSLPNIEIISPCDVNETRIFTKYSYESKQPVYLRLGTDSNSYTDHIYKKNNYAPICLKKTESKIAIVFSGCIYNEVEFIKNNLFEKNIEVSIYSSPIIKPISNDFIEEISENFNIIFTIEDSIEFGGLGSTICEKISEIGSKAKVIRLGFDHSKIKYAMGKNYAMNIFKTESLNKIQKTLEILGLI